MKKFAPYIFSICMFFLFNSKLEFDNLSAAAISIFFFWIAKLFIAANDYLPIKELFLSFYSLQYLFSPSLMYNGLEDYTIYPMKIPSDQYFNFIIPAFIIFSLGFAVFFKSSEFKVNQADINKWLEKNSKVPFVFVAIGFIAPFFYYFLPTQLNFIIYLLQSFKYIGLFILISSTKKLNVLLLVAIYSFIIVSSFVGGMFHDLLSWIVMLGLIISFRYKPKIHYKLIGITFFVVLAIFIQTLKKDLREKIWDEKSGASFELITSLAKDKFSGESFLPLVIFGEGVNRINQGWVLASTINNVPANVGHTHGELITSYLFAATLPRFLAPNKMQGGNTEYFNTYSGHTVNEQTVMVLGLFAEAYIEFENWGAYVYVFCFGLMYGYFLNTIKRNSKSYPILPLFALLVFIYPIRPDCDTQTALGHLFKTSLFLFLMFKFFKDIFYQSYNSISE